MAEWELTDEEIAKAIMPSKPEWWRVAPGHRVIAKAAQHKLVEWLEKNHLCPSLHEYRIEGTVHQDEVHRDDCRLCVWQAMKKVFDK